MWIIGIVVAVALLWYWSGESVDTKDLEERYGNDD